MRKFLNLWCVVVIEKQTGMGSGRAWKDLCQSLFERALEIFLRLPSSSIH